MKHEWLDMAWERFHSSTAARAIRTGFAVFYRKK